ncbi:hypothetical protein [Hymenobacter koreensis]|uniref:DUF2490 domain-containing protein n=1 Tax=Hymenobacter koreensis TaxID=1084523 RepID=A0ABP8IWR1_9BACT
MRHILLAAVLAALAFPFTAAAQRRSVADPVYLPEAQVEVALQGDDYVFGSINLVTNNGNLGGTFAQGQFRLGYEHFWNEQWSWGGTLTGARGPVVTTTVVPELLLRHWNTFGSVNFRQRLGLRYAVPFDEEGVRSRALAALRLDVDRVFALGRIGLRPRLAVEPVLFVRLQRDDEDVKEPFLDFANLRAEIGCRVSDHFDFTPFFAYQSAYSFVLAQFDANGNIRIPAGLFSSVQPVLGVEARVTLFKGEKSTERRQLPTQY